MARLIVNPGTPDVWEIRLKDGVNTLGRVATNDSVINDASVSGCHCELIVSADSVRLKDLGSTNGTFVNLVPVTETILQPGQRIHLGSVELLFEADGAPNTGPAIPQPPRLPATPRPSSRIRITGLSHAPAAVSAESQSVTTLSEGRPVPVAGPSSSAPCKYHPKTLARWLCTKCHKPFCDLCVTTHPAGGAEQKFCRSCGGACTGLQVRLELPEEKSFFRELPRSVSYPFRGTGIMILIVATLLFAALDFMSKGIIGLLMKAVALGYLFCYVQNIIHSTASEDEQMPDLPGMDDVLGGFLQLLGTVLISFGPALVAAYFAIAQEQPAAGIALIPAIIFGCLYFPMAFLAVAIKDTAMAANPLVVVPSILRVPLEYLVTAILAVGLFASRWVGDAIAGVMGERSLRTTSMSEMFLMFGLRVVWAFVSVYLLTVTTRILGLLYLTKRDKLGW